MNREELEQICAEELDGWDWCIHTDDVMWRPGSQSFSGGDWRLEARHPDRERGCSACFVSNYTRAKAQEIIQYLKQDASFVHISTDWEWCKTRRE